MPGPHPPRRPSSDAAVHSRLSAGIPCSSSTSACLRAMRSRAVASHVRGNRDRLRCPRHDVAGLTVERQAVGGLRTQLGLRRGQQADDLVRVALHRQHACGMALLRRRAGQLRAHLCQLLPAEWDAPEQRRERVVIPAEPRNQIADDLALCDGAPVVDSGAAHVDAVAVDQGARQRLGVAALDEGVDQRLRSASSCAPAWSARSPWSAPVTSGSTSSRRRSGMSSCSPVPPMSVTRWTSRPDVKRRVEGAARWVPHDVEPGPGAELRQRRHGGEPGSGVARRQPAPQRRGAGAAPQREERGRQGPAAPARRIRLAQRGVDRGGELDLVPAIAGQDPPPDGRRRTAPAARHPSTWSLRAGNGIAAPPRRRRRSWGCCRRSGRRGRGGRGAPPCTASAAHAGRAAMPPRTSPGASTRRWRSPARDRAGRAPAPPPRAARHGHSRGGEGKRSVCARRRDVAEHEPGQQALFRWSYPVPRRGAAPRPGRRPDRPSRLRSIATTAGLVMARSAAAASPPGPTATTTRAGSVDGRSDPRAAGAATAAAAATRGAREPRCRRPACRAPGGRTGWSVAPRSRSPSRRRRRPHPPAVGASAGGGVPRRWPERWANRRVQETRRPAYLVANHTRSAGRRAECGAPACRRPTNAEAGGRGVVRLTAPRARPSHERRGRRPAAS